jgi:hypothetical protein
VHAWCQINSSADVQTPDRGGAYRDPSPVGLNRASPTWWLVHRYWSVLLHALGRALRGGCGLSRIAVTGAWNRLIEDFIGAVRNDDKDPGSYPSLPTLTDGLRAEEVIVAARRSSSTGRWATVGDEERLRVGQRTARQRVDLRTRPKDMPRPAHRPSVRCGMDSSTVTPFRLTCVPDGAGLTPRSLGWRSIRPHRFRQNGHGTR